MDQPRERQTVDLKASADAFSAFYASEYRNVVALAYALTGRAAVAEELAQDAFLVAHRNWARVSAYDVPGAFVRRVVSNMAVSFTRRLAAEAELWPAWPPARQSGRPPSSRRTPTSGAPSGRFPAGKHRCWRCAIWRTYPTRK